jgi:outer membrane protein
MKNLRKVLLVLALTFGASSALSADTPTVIKTVSFKKIVETSKLGKKEQAAFEAMKGQMEKIVQQKEKEITEIANKLEDPDYLDSMSAEAETELKRKFRTMTQEFSQMQQQYLQTLQQANMKILGMLTEIVGKASDAVAKKNKYDLVLNDDGSFFNNPSLDISSQVVAEMDVMFDEEMKKAPQTPAVPQAAPATKQK